MQRQGSGCVAVALLALLFGAAAGGLAGYFVAKRLTPPTTPVTVSGAACPPSTLQVQSDTDAIVRAVKLAGPSVVKVIAATATIPNMMDYLFGAQPEEQVAIGSGFIFNFEGRQLILTNSHVAGGADRLIAKLTDGRELQGRLAGAEETSDIAIIELVNAPANLPSATLGDSDKLQVGEWVIAIGNPYDYESTVTVGVVSATGYRPVGPNRYQNVIQTDAAINTGNSGGPLVNVAGQVVGINYRIFSPTGATVGIGFAIPINSAKQMLYFLTHGGPYIGLGETVANSPGLAQYIGLATAEGVVVINATPGGPAAQAGLQPRDVILAINGIRIKGLDHLRDELLKHKIGDTIVLTVQRGKDQLQLSMVAGKHPSFGSR